VKLIFFAGRPSLFLAADNFGLDGSKMDECVVRAVHVELFEAVEKVRV
jgi:hypothetical protein